MKIHIFRHFGRIHAFVPLILVTLFLIPAASASYPPNFGMLQGGPYMGGSSFSIPFFLFPDSRVNQSTPGTTISGEGAGWAFEVNDSVWINPSTGIPFTSYAAYLEYTDPATYRNMSPADLALTSREPAAAGYIAFAYGFDRTKFNSIKAISGLSLNYAQFLQIEYPDLYAALPDWVGTELSGMPYLNPVSLANNPQVTPRQYLIPGSMDSTAQLELHQRLLNMDYAASGQFFPVLQDRKAGKIVLPVSGATGDRASTIPAWRESSSLIRSHGTKLSGLQGY